jgi:hypothetical protein
VEAKVFAKGLCALHRSIAMKSIAFLQFSVSHQSPWVLWTTAE